MVSPEPDTELRTIIWYGVPGTQTHDPLTRPSRSPLRHGVRSPVATLVHQGSDPRLPHRALGDRGAEDRITGPMTARIGQRKGTTRRALGGASGLSGPSGARRGVASARRGFAHAARRVAARRPA